MFTPYYPPADLLILLGFVPSENDSWKYYFEPDEFGKTFLQIRYCHPTDTCIITDHYQYPNDVGTEVWKEEDVWCDSLGGLDQLLQILTYCHWEFPNSDTLTEADFIDSLIAKGYLTV